MLFWFQFESFNFTFGNELDIGIEDFLDDNSASAGMLFTAGMKSSWDTKDGIRQTGDIQSQGDGTSIVIRSNDKTFKSTTNDVTSYMMGVFGIETDLAELKYTGNFQQISMIHPVYSHTLLLNTYDVQTL
mgnify:CR=1 FL=1